MVDWLLVMDIVPVGSSISAVRLVPASRNVSAPEFLIRLTSGTSSPVRQVRKSWLNRLGEHAWVRHWRRCWVKPPRRRRRLNHSAPQFPLDRFEEIGMAVPHRPVDDQLVHRQIDREFAHAHPPSPTRESVRSVLANSARVACRTWAIETGRFSSAARKAAPRAMLRMVPPATSTEASLA